MIVKIRNTVIKQRKESSGDLSESHLDLQLSEVMSNRGLKVITAVMVGTRELLAALEELLAVVPACKRSESSTSDTTAERCIDGRVF